ncbi:hypothetical protein E4T50_13013 [Aureobasidium sp. EXF-12298]|nr:hypothetical protein E4T50_13013 [Aureobasidium sp. EXF-12298]
MNNDQFRKLLNTPARQDGASNSPRPSAVPSSLGSKRSSFMPMTPRSVRGASGNDFARQVAERNAANQTQTTKKFKGSAAPKGSRLGSGFTDRTQNRYDDEADDRATRIKALEEQVKLGQLDNATFEALRDQITGGGIEATQFVKGLDRRLLERVRKGEDVLGEGKPADEENLEDEFEQFEEKEVARIEREKVAKKGEMAPPPPVAGAKRSRDQILAELKAQRKAQADARLAARPELGNKFRDVGSSRASSRMEVDAKGREVLITTDEHGNVKTKVRKIQTPVEEPSATAQTHKFLDEGVTVPAPKPVEKPVEALKDDSDDDIFDGVGDDYDPLGGMGDDNSSDDEDGEVPEKVSKPATVAAQPESISEAQAKPESKETTSMPPPPPPAQSSASRNYFKSTTTTTDETAEPQAPQNPFNDAAFLAAIKKAGALSNISLSLNASSTDPSAPESAEAKEARLQKRAQMLAASDRDLEDMDLGFGSSRFGDEEEGEDGQRIKLSTWKGNGDDDDDDGDEGGSKEKKKKGRRRKGDKNSAADVLGVMERRKEAGK